MAITIPLQNHPLVQTAWKIFRIEASQLALPDSPQLMQRTLGVYAVAQAISQLLNHSIIGGIIYGLASAGMAYGWNMGLLRFLKQEEKFNRTVIAIAGGGALAAIAYVVLHFFFAIAFPPPLPTEKLVRFLLFPLIVWQAFLFAFFYRHTALRPVPAFFSASMYVLLVQIILSAICR